MRLGTWGHLGQVGGGFQALREAGEAGGSPLAAAGVWRQAVLQVRGEQRAPGRGRLAAVYDKEEQPRSAPVGKDGLAVALGSSEHPLA